MKSALILLGHSIKRVRALVLAMGLLLAGFQILIVLVGSEIQTSGSFNQFANLVPPFVRQMFGQMLDVFLSFKGIVALGYFHLAIMGGLIGLVIALATVPSSEIETGFMDLLLSRPLARYWIITRALALVVVTIIFMLAMIMLGTWTGLMIFGPADAEWPTIGLILSLALNLGILLLCWGGVALAVASVARRRGAAGAIAGMLALTTFLLDYIGRAWEPAETVAWISPFRYYSPLDLVRGAYIPGHHVFVLLGIALTGIVVAYIAFSRRDI
ncbi:MAG TPA: ABC transporter permease subunit [Blastocatellia bacterium]|jgi:ABC-2 type transport system permease protein